MWLTPALPPKGGRSDLGHHLYAMVTSFTTLDMPQAVDSFSRIGRPSRNGVTVQRYGSSLPAAPNSS